MRNIAHVQPVLRQQFSPLLQSKAALLDHILPLTIRCSQAAACQPILSMLDAGPVRALCPALRILAIIHHGLRM
ncbi:hypothetical protein APE01nite_15840 [Acetobacter peroxydans]|uniref:Uncharacterized protein n=1 Tax=Acetobacter peroxydans TaxID=104098 RepID=A0A4Y3TXD0_9PROT|nr:hypothetical protein AA0475_1736 [Acetobacter peroxydans]GEB85787.1 hypothetical protein APE01nite_15840 [Acetobacter peroxydans]